MGVVYRAQRADQPGPVALKLLSAAAASGPGAVLRFEQECRAASRLDHPQVVAVYDFGRHGNCPYLAMELVEGEDLAAHVQRVGPRAPLEAARLGVQICAGLAHAHERQVLHRDLKPENVVLHPTRGALVTDFGLAKVLSASQGVGGLTASTDLLGSPVYMSPEQANADHHAIDERTDVYGVGAILYELLTGRPPVLGQTLHEVLVAVTTAPIESPRVYAPAVPERLAAIVLRCLEKRPEDRFSSVSALGAELQSFLAQPRAEERGRLLRVAGGLLGLAGLLALVVSGLALALGRPRRGPALATPSPDPAARTSAARAGAARTSATQASAPAPPPPSLLPEDDQDLIDSTSAADLARLRAQVAQLLERRPGSARLHLDLGRVLLAQEDAEGAQAAAERALELAPELGAAHRLRGMALLRGSYQPAALRDFERALELDPGDWQALRQRGVVRLNRERYQLALADFDASWALRPSAAVAATRGYALTHLRRFDKAEQAYREALELSPDDDTVLENLSKFALRGQRVGEALAYHRRRMELRPGEPALAEGELELLLRAERNEEVRARAEGLADLDQRPRALTHLASALVELKQIEAARARVEAALALTPRDPKALLVAVRVYGYLQRWEALVEVCERLLALTPEEQIFTEAMLARVRRNRDLAAQQLER